MGSPRRARHWVRHHRAGIAGSRADAYLPALGSSRALTAFTGGRGAAASKFFALPCLVRSGASRESSTSDADDVFHAVAAVSGEAVPLSYLAERLFVSGETRHQRRIRERPLRGRRGAGSVSVEVAAGVSARAAIRAAPERQQAAHSGFAPSAASASMSAASTITIARSAFTIAASVTP